MFLNFSAFVELEAPSPAVFGMTISRLDLDELVRRIAAGAPRVRSGASILVTADMRHVARMRRDSTLCEAMQTADVVTCAQLPLMRYARFRGCTLPGAIAGCDIVDALLDPAVLVAPHRAYFVTASEKDAAAIRTWVTDRGISAEVEVAPASLGTDGAAGAALAERVAAFGTTMLFLGIGAPAGELFAARHRAQLPDGCWALCVGDVLGAALALVETSGRRQAPRRSMRKFGRLAGRYLSNTLGFGLSVYQELTAPSSTKVVPARHTPVA